MATHSSVLAWRIPGTGEPGGLPFMGSRESDTIEVTQRQQQLQVQFYIFICCLLFRSRQIEELRMSLHFFKLSVAPPWTDLEMVFFSFSLSLCCRCVLQSSFKFLVEYHLQEQYHVIKKSKQVKHSKALCPLMAHFSFSFLQSKYFMFFLCAGHLDCY